MRDELIEFLKKNIKFKLDFDKLVEKPKLDSQGDFSLPMFLLAKELQKNPAQIATEFEEKLSKSLPDFIEKIVAIGPFLNFYLNKEQEAKEVLNSISSNRIFNIKINKPQKVLIEYPSPNTNKSLHLGHVRNMLLGNSLTKIFQKVGHKVIKTNMNNDRGIAICKSMLGYELFFKNETPKSLNLKPDEFVSKCYVKFEAETKKDESLNQKAQEMLVKWEANDKEVRALWKKVMNWVFEGYTETYKNYKLGNYDIQYYESIIYKDGKELVLNALKNKVQGFGIEDDGAIFCDCEDVGFDKKYLLRGDGTTLYMTQDLNLAYLKDNQFKPDMSVFIVGKDQEYHFKVLFEILGRIGFGGNDKNFHFAYGYVYNKEGKKFSSRKGDVIGADWMLKAVIDAAKKNLLSKEISKSLTQNELKRRANIIGYSALTYSMLKANPLDDLKFDIDKSLEMTGETGPYVQYTYARIQSVLKKANYKSLKTIDYKVLGNKESSLISILKDYPSVVIESAKKYKPSHIANYLIRICQSYNEFYQNCQILKEKDDLKNARLLLCDCTSKVIRDGLELLDIEVLDEM